MKSIDVVYVLGTGSRHNDSELKYSIRSVIKNVKNVRHIFVVGNCPTWAKGLIHLPCRDTHVVPDLNIRDKILMACNCELVTPQFLFMNDDHFILDKYNAPTFPFYHKGLLTYAIGPRRFDNYRERLNNTEAALEAKGLTTWNYDTHTPIIYDKEKFKEMVRAFDWDTPNGFVIKSLYGNFHKVKGVFMKDFKVTNLSNIKEETKIFSTKENIPAELQDYLKAQWPNKSPFEY